MTVVATERPLRVGQQDTVFEAQVVEEDENGVLQAVDLSGGGGTYKIKHLGPGGETLEEDATFTTDGSDGKIQWKDTVGDAVASDGWWKYWPVVTLPSGDGPFPGSPLLYPVADEGESP